MSRRPRTVVSDEPLRLPLRHGLVALLYLRAPAPPADRLPLEGEPGWDIDEEFERAKARLSPAMREAVGFPPEGGAA